MALVVSHVVTYGGGWPTWTSGAPTQEEHVTPDQLRAKRETLGLSLDQVVAHMARRLPDRYTPVSYTHLTLPTILRV